MSDNRFLILCHKGRVPLDVQWQVALDMLRYLRDTLLPHCMDRGELDAFFAGLEVHDIFSREGKVDDWSRQWSIKQAQKDDGREYFVTLGDLEAVDIHVPAWVREAFAGQARDPEGR